LDDLSITLVQFLTGLVVGPLFLGRRLDHVNLSRQVSARVPI
jgi:hypothetical protein